MRRLTLFACALVLVSTAAAAQEAKQDFKLINRTGYALNEAYLAPASSDEWQDDVLGKYQLEDGNTKNIHFSPKTKTCKWDLKVVYTEDKSEVVWHDINLCDTSAITLFYNKKTDKTSAKFD